MKIIVMLFTLFTLFVGNTFAKVYTRWHLPKDAKARLGKGWIGDIQYAPDGARLAVASSIGIWFYDTQMYQEIALLTGYTNTFRNVAFSPDGQTLAASASRSRSWDDIIRVWDVATGAHRHTFAGHSSAITSIAFSPDGRTLASGSTDRTIRLWDVVTGASTGILTGPTAAAIDVVFSPDGEMLASVSGDIHLWDVATGAHKGTLRGHTGSAISIAFSPDGRTLARGGDWRDNTVRLWDVVTGEHKHTLVGHSSGVESIAFSPDGQTLASGDGDAILHLWEVVTGERKHTLVGHLSDVVSIAFSPDGETLSSGSRDGTVRFWDAITGTHKGTLREHTEGITSIAFSPDGKTLLSGGYDRTIYLWDAVTGEHKRIFTGHTRSVDSIAFSPDGQMLASGGWDDTIRLWDAVTGTQKQILTGHTDPVTSVAFSPDGETLSSGSWDGNVYLWEVATGTQKQILTGHVGRVESVAFSPDGQTLASGGGWTDNTIRLWDVTTGKQKRKLNRHTESVTSLAFSPDGRTLASGSWDASIRLWDVGTGEQQQVLTGHRRHIESVVFSPDGRTLASGGGWQDGTIHLWNTVTGEHKRTFIGHTGKVASVAFSPDGQTLASGGQDGTILLWEFTPSLTPNTSVRIEPSSIQAPAIGVPLTLSLNIADGENVAGYQATVQFDPTALRYVESTNGDYLKTDAFFVTPEIVNAEMNLHASQVKLAATSLAGKGEGDGTLATLTFEVVAVKASALILSDVLLSDSAGKSSRPWVAGGQVMPPPQTIFGDANRDGVVNVLDLVHVGSNFGQLGPNEADINEDGIVDIVDLVLVAGTENNPAAAPSVYSLAVTMLTAADVQGWLTQAQQLYLTDVTSQRGIRFLDQLLTVLTPNKTMLLPNYPNPFNPETWIPYHLAHDSDVTLTIYNTKGAMVRQLYVGHQPAGFYMTRTKAFYWDGCNESGESVASGVYFYQLCTGDYTATRRMVIVK